MKNSLIMWSNAVQFFFLKKHFDWIQTLHMVNMLCTKRIQRLKTLPHVEVLWKINSFNFIL